MTEHLYIPDTQVKRGVPTEHIQAAGELIIDRKPDVVIVGGDWWDFPSLNTHTPKERICYDHRSYMEDFVAGLYALTILLEPINTHNEKRRKNKEKQYRPRMVFTLGNHEYRAERLLEQQPMLSGAIPRVEDEIAHLGFEVHEYKQPVVIDGVTYCHNCPQPNAAGCVSRAHLIMNKRHASWTVGHTPGLDYFVSPHEPRIQCLVTGSFYMHDEDFKKGSNDHHRGLVYKRHVHNGTYDPEFISIRGLLEDYG